MYNGNEKYAAQNIVYFHLSDPRVCSIKVKKYLSNFAEEYGKILSRKIKDAIIVCDINRYS